MNKTKLTQIIIHSLHINCTPKLYCVLIRTLLFNKYFEVFNLYFDFCQKKRSGKQVNTDNKDRLQLIPDISSISAYSSEDPDSNCDPKHQKILFPNIRAVNFSDLVSY